ncbi:sensor histidine kinase [Rufibacter tibetensis]|uniref:sensor histidine kinase n=1 Tax=Rufibacter tibetensis TaxID=512763 RepID=UPI0007856324|nr:HAMP domain-containing sensor histidine kinase [Rufibacter tibetensis]
MKNAEQTCQQQLEELKKEYEEFAYIVSHDLKAPLRAISNLSEWIREDLGENLEPDVKQNITLLQSRTERMERMINGLLVFSRVPRYDLEIKPVNVQELLELVVTNLDKEQNVVVHASNLPTLTTYSKKLETVFVHLLQNAITYTQQVTPEIWVEATEQEEHFLFKVKDNGIGIPAEAHEKVFKMFYSIQPKDLQANLGVGLTICRKILQFVGGSIWLESEPGTGSVFTFLWPKSLETSFVAPQ